MASSKPALTVEPTGTATASAAGATVSTVGATVSGGATVVKLQAWSAASGLPRVSVTAVVSRAV